MVSCQCVKEDVEKGVGGPYSVMPACEKRY